MTAAAQPLSICEPIDPQAIGNSGSPNPVR